MTQQGETAPLARQEVPLLEFDPSPAIIEPWQPEGTERLPEHCVLAFFGDRVKDLAARGELSVIGDLGSEMGPHLIYALDRPEGRVAVVQPGVGAPFGAAVVDELWARGCRFFVVCGGCGVLDRDITPGHLLVPVRALRDEGTSYHYLAPGRWAEPTPRALQAVCAELDERGLPYLKANTWTTDAFYRETPAKIALRREEGCLCVEMEASALFAAARFRGVELAQILYAGDDVSGEQWDSREWNNRHDLREALIYLAADTVLRL